MNNLRLIDERIKNHFNKWKQIMILLGARQVGKTTLIKRLFPGAFYLLVDNSKTKADLEKYDITAYKQFLPAENKEVIIDEIHLLSDPGRAAKIIYDQIPDIKLIITGSSSLNIKNKVAESLAGRKIDYRLYPLTFSEYLYQKEIDNKFSNRILENIVNGNTQEKLSLIHVEAILENVLMYGLYPHTVNAYDDKEYLQNLSDSIIFKDLIELRSIENREGAQNLLKLLAFQIGSLVNIFELSNKLGMETRTVKRYLNIFEQSFIVFSLSPYHQKGRDEIGKMKKYYFYDIGLRNALINDFSNPKLRNDYGNLFENFVIAEIVKENYYGSFEYKMNFWRTKQGSEIDLVLTREDELIGVEIKTGKERVNKAFKNRYPNAKIYILNPTNFY